MAIDSLRKRASIASLGLAFLGPSVVPDGSLAQADRQTVGHSYYGILVSDTTKTIGATSQIGALASTGGLTVQVQHTLGGSSQLAIFDATGGLQVGRVLGGVSQTDLFTSSGGIQVGDDVGAGGTPARVKKKRESLEDLRKASQAAILRRRKAEELEAKVQAQLEEAVPAGATIEYDPQAMRIASIKAKVDRELAIEFEAQRQAEAQLMAEEETRKRRKRDQIAVLLLLH